MNPFKVMRNPGGGAPPVAPIALVQSPALDRSASGIGVTTQNYTWGTKPTVGNKVIWGVSQYGAGVIATITDNATPPNTFTSRISRTGGNVVEWLFEGDIVNVPVGPYVTTINYTGTVYPTVAPQEWSGLKPGNSYDVGSSNGAAAGAAIANPYSTGSTVTLTQADNAIISLFGFVDGTSNVGASAPSGYILDQLENDSSSWMPLALAHKIVSANTAVSAGWPNSATSGDVAALVGVFKGL